MAETAIVVLIPELESLLGEPRRRYTGDGARGMPTHVTLIFPFADSSEVDARLTVIARMLGAFAPFELTFSETARFPGFLYLRPEPARPFVAMTEALAAAFPDFPPYGEEFDEIVPHVTVARADEGVLAALESELAPRLPAKARVERGWLVENTSGRWRRHTAFPLDRHTRV